jgi:hypothetical protein
MPILYFLPWCRLSERLDVNPVSFIPFNRNFPPSDFDDATARLIRSISEDFIAIDGEPVSEFTVLSLENTCLREDFDASGPVFAEFVDLIRLASLSARDYFFGRADPYSNSTCFALYSRRVDDAGKSWSPTLLRKDGIPIFLAGVAMRVHVPIEAATIPRPSMNVELLTALAARRRKAVDFPAEWAAWQEAIYCFDQANTDAEVVDRHMEWVLTSGAIERVLLAQSKADDAAERFGCALSAIEPVIYFDTRVLRDWCYEFYRLRGDFAHAKIRSQQPRTWVDSLHNVFGAIAFPLLIKALLAKTGEYSLSPVDHSEIAAFARMLLDTRRASGPTRSWREYVSEQGLMLATRMISGKRIL